MATIYKFTPIIFGVISLQSTFFQMDLQVVLIGVIALLGAAMAFLPLFKDVLVDRSQKIIWSNISWSGWVIFGLLAMCVILTMWKEKLDRDEIKENNATAIQNAARTHTQDSVRSERDIGNLSNQLKQARDTILRDKGEEVEKIHHVVDSMNSNSENAIVDRYIILAFNKIDSVKKTNKTHPSKVYILLGYNSNGETLASKLRASLEARHYTVIWASPTALYFRGIRVMNYFGEISIWIGTI
jgi:hypothetical protein